MNVIAIIPIKGNSEGVPGKHTKLICGKTCISYAMEHLMESRLISRRVVCTEDKAIATLANSLGFEVVRLPVELAQNPFHSTDAVKYACEYFVKKGWVPDIVVETYAATPVCPKNVFDILIDQIIETGADSAFALEPVPAMLNPKFHLQLTPNGRVYWPNGYPAARRQDNEPVYHQSGSAFVVRWSVLSQAIKEEVFDPTMYWGKDILGVVFDEGTTVDINDPANVLWAEYLLARGNNA